jgi:hypothetical protein
MNGSLKEILEIIIKGAPNFIGFLVALIGALYIINSLLARNTALTDALLSCAAGH